MQTKQYITTTTTTTTTSTTTTSTAAAAAAATTTTTYVRSAFFSSLRYQTSNSARMGLSNRLFNCMFSFMLLRLQWLGLQLALPSSMLARMQTCMPVD